MERVSELTVRPACDESRRSYVGDARACVFAVMNRHDTGIGSVPARIDEPMRVLQ